MVKKIKDKDIETKFIFQPTDGRTKFCHPYMVPGAEVTIIKVKPNVLYVLFGRRNRVDIVSRDFVKEVKVKVSQKLAKEIHSV